VFNFSISLLYRRFTCIGYRLQMGGGSLSSIQTSAAKCPVQRSLRLDRVWLHWL